MRAANFRKYFESFGFATSFAHLALVLHLLERYRLLRRGQHRAVCEQLYLEPQPAEIVVIVFVIARLPLLRRHLRMLV